MSVPSFVYMIYEGIDSNNCAKEWNVRFLEIKCASISIPAMTELTSQKPRKGGLHIPSNDHYLPFCFKEKSVDFP